MSEQKTQKAAQTKQRLLDAALALFQEAGYEGATMRAIAKAAGMSPGAAYYYFPSKEHLIFEYYKQSYEDHLPLAEAVLATETTLQARLAGVVKAHIDVAQPFHALSLALYQVASQPHHPLSPFSPASKPLRDTNIAFFDQVIDPAAGNETKIPKNLAASLPELLWLYKMGVIQYWLYDDSPERAKTYAFIDQTSDLVVRLLSMANLPLTKTLTDKVVGLVHTFKPYD